MSLDVWIRSDGSSGQAAPREGPGASDLPGEVRWILKAVCTMFGWDLGQVWMVDPWSGTLSVKTSLLRAPELAPLVEASRHITVRQGEGLPGRVWADRKGIWLDDDSPLAMPRRPAASTCGVRNAFAVPLFSGERVVGVLEFCCREKRESQPFLLDVTAAIAADIGGSLEGQPCGQALLTAFRTADVPIAVLGRSGVASTTHLVNAAFSRFTGFSATELLGRRATLVASGRADPDTLARLGVALDEGRGFTCELPVRRKDGTEVLCEWQVAPAFERPGSVVQHVLMLRDVSERAAAHQVVEERSRECAVIDQLSALEVRDQTELSALLGGAARLIGEGMGVPFVSIETNDLAQPKCESCSVSQDGCSRRGTYYVGGERLLAQAMETRELVRDGTTFGTLKVGGPAAGSIAWLNGVVLAVISLIERYRTRAKVNQDDEQRALVLRSVSDAVWSISLPDMRVLYASPAVSQMFDTTPVMLDVEGAGALWRHVAAEDRQRQEQAHLDLFAGKPLDLEWRLVRGEEVRWIHCRAWATRCPEGRVIRVDGISRDVTEQHRAREDRERLESSLQRAALEWRLTFDAVEVPIFILSADGAVCRLNRAAQDLAGSSYANLIGRRIDELGTGEPWARAAQMVQEARSDVPPPATQVWEPSSGTTWEISATQDWEPLLEEPRIILTARDITPIIRLQSSLRRSETMATMGNLVAGVAHEVRNPLFGISATLDAFQARFGGSPQFDEYTRVLRLEVGRMNDLMSDLLEYGKPPGLDLRLCRLDDAVSLAIRSCQALATKARVRVVSQMGATSQRVRMDIGRMSQVFANLLENAIQHAGPEGSVRVRLSTSLERGRPFAVCEVHDSGPGFRDGDLPHLFEPFFTRRRGGTGLGLAIVQRIVEQHDGAITAGNRPAGGAVVTVRFPCADEEG